MPTPVLSRGTAALLLGIVVVTWGINWSVSKAVLQHVPPIWSTGIRMIPACLVLWVACLATRTLALPRRGDLPAVLGVSLLHMVAFSVLANLGLQFLPAGRSVVLAYTTPLWVMPAAWLFLGEPLGRRRLAGLVLGMAGLACLLQPASMDWSDPAILQGHGLILLAAMFWAACIVLVRANPSVTSPFRLLPWQTLIAGACHVALALALEGWPSITWSGELVALFAFSSLVGTVLAYWAMNTVNRGLPASVTAMGLLGVPVVGLVGSTLMLGERLDATLLLSSALVVAGITLGTLAPRGTRIRA